MKVHLHCWHIAYFCRNQTEARCVHYAVTIHLSLCMACRRMYIPPSKPSARRGIPPATATGLHRSTETSKGSLAHPSCTATLVWCWNSVGDAGPALRQRWLSVQCELGILDNRCIIVVPTLGYWIIIGERCAWLKPHLDVNIQRKAVYFLFTICSAKNNFDFVITL